MPQQQQQNNNNGRGAFQHFFETYGMIMPTLEEQNRDNMKKKWLPSQGMEALIYQIEQGMVFAYFTQNPFIDKQLVSAFMLQIIGAGVYALHLKDWRARGESNMNFVGAKEFWKKYHIQMQQDCAGRSFGFDLNA